MALTMDQAGDKLEQLYRAGRLFDGDFVVLGHSTGLLSRQQREAYRRLRWARPWLLSAAYCHVSLSWSRSAEYGLSKLLMWLGASLGPAFCILILRSTRMPLKWSPFFMLGVWHCLTITAGADMSALAGDAQ